ncbi:uncharacterized protein TRAVEDRAFT_43140 [Trametes versicolor FP-101664 SS1]|uniref:uncharacterized protein n=1 Tax=Trametes versicolor (strain FP-101664) TaxID=717944 RepID=UPI0004623A7A|nr:uncharacterized protein TRAVEDRAFT_43140 [Trametes versicolor FP-101664 SS1]EIW62819.1 hypothetical protein TRAVEDRAFT_43140 [Trametes versicolor FP-101664 SS1]
MAEVPIFTEHLAPILMEPERQEEFLYFGESADSDSAHSPSEGSASDILPAMSQQQLGFYGFNLQSAFQEDVQGLVDPNGQAFQVQLKQKMTVIFLFPGWERYSRQVHVHTANKTSHTRGKLANVIAKEMVQFMAATSKEGRPLRSQEGKIVELQDLVLVDISHVSQGSLQPTIGVIRRS